MRDDHHNVGVVAWPVAQRYLRERATQEFRLAAKGQTEFERGRRSGRGEMCEDLMNLPEALALLAEEDERETRRHADGQGTQRDGNQVRPGT